jgi:hypothetical protein
MLTLNEKNKRTASFACLCLGLQCLPAWAGFIPNLQEKPKKTSSPAPVTDPLRAELIFWSSIQDSTDPREFKAYLKKYPKGQFAEVAKIRIEKYTPVVAAPPPVEIAPVVAVPTPVEITPVVTAPTPVEITPVVTAPTPVETTPVETTPVVTVPTPVEITPVVTAPTPVEITPVVAAPTPVEITPVVAAPTPVEITPVVATPTPVEITPVVATPTPVEITPVVTAPTPVEITPVVALTTEPQEAYTKLDANGKPLPKSANHWDCVLDNKTKLIWEEKTNNGGLRDKNWTYTWYDPNQETNGGSVGYQDRHEYKNDEPLGKSCGNTLSSCNTLAYVDAVNKGGGICGHSNWKMPTVVQLKTLVTSQVYQHPFASFKWPIHSSYFHSLPIDLIGYWSSLAAPGLDKNAWIVALHNGYGNFEYKSNNAHIRLVYVPASGEL